MPISVNYLPLPMELQVKEYLQLEKVIAVEVERLRDIAAACRIERLKLTDSKEWWEIR